MSSIRLSYHARASPHFWPKRARVLYHPVFNLGESQPNKFFEYMSVGLPLIASDLPIYGAFSERERCGILLDPEDPRAIAEAIDCILTNSDEASAMGDRGRAAVESTYDWAAESRQRLATMRR